MYRWQDNQTLLNIPIKNGNESQYDKASQPDWDRLPDKVSGFFHTPELLGNKMESYSFETLRIRSNVKTLSCAPKSKKKMVKYNYRADP